LSDVDAALAHLRAADPVLARLVDEHGELDLIPAHRRGHDHYTTLVRSITGQQLSVKAAATIFGRVLELFGGSAPTPEQLLAADPDALRTAGLSRAKVAYLRSLAEHVIDGSLELERLTELPDEDVMRELVAIKGVGEWTAHMFLMFQLGRPDVLPVGDLGIRRAVQVAYGLDALPASAEVERIAEPWRPWRTVACRYLWESLDNTPAP
jgi:DNA-3-methyladenine glycosylase II